MADPLHHAVSSARKYGGKPEDYLHLHQWFDQTKGAYADIRHRAILHSSFGIQLCIDRWGQSFRRRSDNRVIPVRWIGEQHVIEDLGRIPTIENWLHALPMEDWMRRGARKLSVELQDDRHSDPQPAAAGV